MPQCDVYIDDVACADLPVGVASCVYADPPYGTGRHFGSYADGRKNDPIRDVIKAAHRVLRPGGFFWLHLDDRRAFSAKAAADEVFGERNFITSVVWQRSLSPGSSVTSANISRTHDIIMMYVKDGGGRLYGRPRGDEAPTLFATPDHDSRPWRRDSLATHGPRKRHPYGIMNPLTGKLYYPQDGQHWRWTRTKILSLLLAWSPNYRIDAEGNLVTDAPCPVAQARLEQHPWPLLYFGNRGKTGPQVKSYRSETIAWTTWWPADQVGSTSDASLESKAIAGRAFPTTKPEALMRRILDASSTSGDIVVELCAGSAPMTRVALRCGRSAIAVEMNPQTVEDYIRPGVRGLAPLTVHGSAAPKNAAPARVPQRSCDPSDG